MLIYMNNQAIFLLIYEKQRYYTKSTFFGFDEEQRVAALVCA
jgi:hypothetical protein